MSVIQKLRENMASELTSVGSEIVTAQKTLENLARRQEQLKGAVYALDVALSELSQSKASDASDGHDGPISTDEIKAVSVETN